MQMLQCLFTDLGIDPDKDLADQYDFTKTTASDADGVQRAPHGSSAAWVSLYIVVTLRKMFSVLMTRKKLARR